MHMTGVEIGAQMFVRIFGRIIANTSNVSAKRKQETKTMNDT